MTNMASLKAADKVLVNVLFKGWTVNRAMLVILTAVLIGMLILGLAAKYVHNEKAIYPDMFTIQTPDRQQAYQDYSQPDLKVRYE